MRKKVRKTAINIIGDVPWGTHFCQFYQTKEDMIDILVPYFKAGLENNEFCMWITSEPLHVEDAKRALKEKVNNLDDYIQRGHIEILDFGQWYTKSGRFDSDRVLRAWVEKEKLALERGFDGLRLTGNTFWLEKKDWKDFTDYEAAVNSVIGKHRMLAICTYCLDKCTASEIMDVVSNHQFAVIKREGKWEIIESTEYKKTIEELRQSEARYRVVVEDQTELIVRWLPGGVITFVNDAYCSYFGKSRQELIGHSFMPLIPYEDREKVKRHFDSLDRENPVTTHEHRVVDSNGEIRWQQWTNRVLFDERGNLVEYQSVGRDITEHKQAEEALRESEDKYHAIFAQAADSIVLIDPENGALVDFNDRAHESLGYTRQELRRLKIPDFDVIESADKVAKHIEKIVRQGTDLFETKHRTKSGEIRDILASSRAISIGGRDFVQSIWRDITEHKQAEEALRIHDLRLQALLDLNKMTTASQQQILDFVREEVIKITQSEFAFICFINHDESVMTINNWSKGTMPKCAVTDKPMHFPIAEAGLWGEAVRQRKPVVINDYNAPNPRKKGCPKGHVPIKRFLGTPVFEGERIVAVAAVANKEKDYDDSDVHTVTSMMNDTWRLIQRKRAQEQVRNLAKFPSENPFPVLRIAEDGTILYSNDAGSALLSKWERQVGESAPHDWCQLIGDVLDSN
ncbi:MAG TPA: MEDS domain-containing protein, partial [Sedimentisphaerales bacterium]|nr:MEDS domain-containing protein [Sedimentisphaerales bacterium]